MDRSPEERARLLAILEERRTKARNDRQNPHVNENVKNKGGGSNDHGGVVPPEVKRVVNTDYDRISDVVIGKRSSVPWSDTFLNTVPKYDVNQVQPADIISLGQQLVQQFAANKINMTTADICLTLALSLPVPSTTQFSHLLKPPTAQIGKSLQFTTPSATASSGLTTVQSATLEKAKKGLATETDEDQKRKYSDTIARLEAIQAGLGTSTSIDAKRESEAASYCFLAACLLKIYGKDPGMFIAAVPSMKQRFAAWYDGPPTALDSVILTETLMSSLRVVLARRPELLSTWTLWLSYNENKDDKLLITQQGLLNYLGCQQFSYAGMHAYSLIVEIHEQTGMTFSDLLKELDCPTTRSGVKAVFDIIKDHEVTDKAPNRTTYFRYARNWDPKYFGSLQSSNCKTLVYVVASVSKKISSQGSKGDPMEIYAIKDMDKAMTDRLEAVALRLTDKIIDKMITDEKSGEAWH